MTKNEMENIIDNRLALVYEPIEHLTKKEDKSFYTHGSSWASTVAIDIVGFKNLVKEIDNEKMVKIIQLFNELITREAHSPEYKEYIRDIYYVQDEVMVIFDGNSQDGVTRATLFAASVNSLINNILSKRINITLGIQDFKAGIGIWTSKENSLVRTHIQDLKTYTSSLIGVSIHNARRIAKSANRNGKPAILLNGLTFSNLFGEAGKAVMNLLEAQPFNLDNITLYGGNLVQAKYN